MHATGTGLVDWQHAFQQHLLTGDPAVLALVRPGPGMGLERRLNIYHHAYRARLVGALRETFGHTALYLGDDWFDRDALAYVEAQPSAHANLNHYGESLPAWWAERFPGDGDIAELATLDWALRRAFDGPDAAPLGAEALQALPPAAWAALGFQLHPTVRLLLQHHNTLALWTALDSEQTPPRAAPLPAPVAVLVWRVGHQPHFRSLSEAEALALQAVQQGEGFAAVCARLAALLGAEAAAVEAGGLLNRWLEDGLLVGLTGL